MKEALVIVPHQDDEINLVGNIVDVIKKNWNIKILFSSLDSNIKQGKIRKKEAVKACAVWGIEESQIIFLEYPDTANKHGNHFYTNGDIRIEEELKNFILKIRPEVIFATDFDFHSDHRMLSLAFEHVMGEILKSNIGYFPIVLKGFCYEMAYYGAEDYLVSRKNNCVQTSKLLSNVSYEWNDRLSISSVEKRGFIWKRRAYKALSKHKSQYAVLHAMSIINDENVFWQRRTDNLVFNAKLDVSSGCKEKICDFMIIDTNDIITLDSNKIDYEKASWIPSDASPWICLEWENAICFDKVIIHGNPNAKEKQKVHIKLIADDKLLCEIFVLNEFGKNTVIWNQAITCKKLKLEVLERDKLFGISELEVFKEEQSIPRCLQDDMVCEKKYSNLKIFDKINNVMYKVIVILYKVRRKLHNVISINK